MREIVLVFIGGGLGSVARYPLVLWVFSSTPGYPVATLVSNTLACFILGVLTGFLIDTTAHDSGYWPLLMAGVCGGVSTFSTLVAEINQYKSSPLLVGYVGASLCLGLFVFWLGLKWTTP